MPIDADYIRMVIQSYSAHPNRMGQFPMPDFEVVAAAEILKDHIVQGPSSHAVEVARVRVGDRDRFVFANSGAPGALQVNVDGARDDLHRLIPRADYIQVQRGFDFYEPQHRNVDAYLRRARENFDVNQDPPRYVRQQDVTTAIATFREHFLGMDPRQREVLNRRLNLVRRAARVDQSIRNERNALAAVLACAVALRLRVVEAGDRVQVRDTLTGFATFLQRLAVLPWLPTIGNAITTLVTIGDQVNAPALNVQALQSAVAEAFRVARQSRFCAEPRVFAEISHQEGAQGPLLSQACFWFIGTDNIPNPQEYRVIGPQTHPDDAAQSGSYMWACSSCRARSQQMLNGIRIMPPGNGRVRPHEV